MSTRIALAVDLGTTFTTASTLSGSRLVNHQFPGNGRQVPSAIFVPTDGSPVLVGRKARNASVRDPSRLLEHFKRRMTTDPHERLIPDGPTPVEATASVLRYVVRIVSQNDPDLETALANGSATVAITHPAGYHSEHQSALLEAAGLAGVQHDQVVFASEPAACVYAFLKAEQSVRDDETILVVDVGGGTTDVALLVYRAGLCHELIADRGDARLGGINFDGALFGELCERFGLTALCPAYSPERGLDLSRLPGDAERRQAVLLWDLAIETKQTLGAENEHQVFADLPAGLVETTITRDEFLRIANGEYAAFARAVATCLDGSAYALTDVDHVMLAGGSALLPGLREHVATACGRAPENVHLHVEPEYVVSSGAAHFAADGRTTDSVVPGGLGVIVERRENGSVERFGKMLIPPGRSLPSTGTTYEDLGQFVDARHETTRIAVEFCEARPGVSTSSDTPGPLLLRESECSVLGSVQHDFEGLPPGSHEVRLGLDYTGRRMSYRLGFEGLPLEVVCGSVVDGTSESENAAGAQARFAVLLIDRSKSMQGTRLLAAKAAATAFVDATPDDTRIGVVSFGTDVTVHCAPVDDSALASSAIASVSIAGSTNMHLGIDAALELVSTESGGLIVLLTDGHPNTVEKTIAAARRDPAAARIVTVGIEGADHDFLKYHVAASPADHFPVDQLDDLVATYERIARLYVL